MDRRLDWTQLLFSSAERLPRAPFITVGAVLLGVYLLYATAAPHALRVITGWLVYPLLAFCGGAITAKRLHDRGRSGWWAALVLVAVAAVATPPQSYVDVLFWLVLVWSFIELCLMPGEQGANRFGPNPRSPARPEALVTVS